MLLKFKMVISIVFLSFFLTACEDNQFSDLFWPDDDEDIVCKPDTTPVSFKKVGFWSDSQDHVDDYLSLNYDQLDTLNYAFIDVTSDGEIVQMPQDKLDRFHDLMVLARNKSKKTGIKLGISIGGGSDANFKTIAESNSRLNTFSKNIVDCLNGCTQLDNIVLDGIDLYWRYPEGKDEAKLFEKMVKHVSEKVKAAGKYFTITIVSGEDKDLAKGILHDVFQYIDYANVMAFNEDESGELHSNIQDAKNAIAYWHGRCLVKNKIVLGVPFYSGGKAKETFMTIVGKTTPSKARACKDKSNGKDYNGIPTIIEKTKYSQANAGGIMMRYIERDALPSTTYSLLDAIDKTVSSKRVTACNP